MIGRVVSTKMAHTAVVLVTGTKVHPLYKKTFVSSNKYLADDPVGVTLGQVVEIVAVRPISKRKNWRVTKVVGRDIEAIVSEQLKEQAEEAIEEVMPEEDSNVAMQQSSEAVEESNDKSSKTKKKGKKTA